MKISSRICSTIAAFLSLAASALAQVDGPPGLIDYQGQLLNSLGGPITGTGGPGTSGTSKNYEIRFRIWDAQTGGNLIWAEKQIVTVSEVGLFSVRLGEGEEITDAANDPSQLAGSVANGTGALLGAFNDNERFLGVTVMNPPATPGEIQPRLAFLSSPFAMIAETARFAESGPSGAAFTAASVGVGTASPETALHVAGTVLINDGKLGTPANGALGGDGTSIVLWRGGSGSTPYAIGMNSGTLWHGVPSNASHKWYSGTTETMSLNPTGNLRINGHLTLGSGGILDDDTTLGGEADDWIRLGGYIDMKSNTDNYGIVLRDKDTSNFLGLTQIDGKSYFADSTTASNYFLVGDGRNATVPGDFNGGQIYTGGWLRNHNAGTGIYNQSTGMHFYSEEDAQFSLFDNSTNNVKIRFKTAGNVTNGYAYADVGNGGQIGFLSKAHAWTLITRHTNGTRYASYDGDSNWDFYSDRRLKKNIRKEENILDRIVQLNVVNYDFKDESNKEKEIGFIAQDVEPHFPSIVSESEDPRYDYKVKALGYSSFGIIAIGGIQELKAEKDEEINTVTTRIDELESENAKLRAELTELKERDAARDEKIAAIEKLLLSDKSTAQLVSASDDGALR